MIYLILFIPPLFQKIKLIYIASNVCLLIQKVISPSSANRHRPIIEREQGSQDPEAGKRGNDAESASVTLPWSGEKSGEVGFIVSVPGEVRT